jgi:glutathione synthase/RimK-type ligase-like ATP-grasp enzyme
MWHLSHIRSEDILFGKQLIYALEHSGMKIFPNFKTMWHFDDKIGQKYLLEATNAPFVETYIFYSKREALEWAESTIFPKVFKLRGGSASSNVRLVKDEKEAKKIINKAFNKGFKQRFRFADIAERYRQYRLGKGNLRLLIGGLFRLIKPHNYEKIKGNEVGYVYFQDFIPDNDSDVRVIVINKKAFAIKRMVRQGDFRASGSGLLHYSKDNFNEEMIKIALNLAQHLELQSFAVDFVFKDGKPLIVEMSYGFPNRNFIEGCVGYWDEELNFHEGFFNPYGWMVESLRA